MIGVFVVLLWMVGLILTGLIIMPYIEKYLESLDDDQVEALNHNIHGDYK